MKQLIWILCLLTLTSCSDPSPIKSDIEVRFNELFGTKFGVVDQVYIYSGKEELAFLNPKEFSGYLEGIEEIKKEKYNKDITIVLSTSDGMKKYSREQTSESLYYDLNKNILCNKNSCYKVSESFSNKIKNYY